MKRELYFALTFIMLISVSFIQESIKVYAADNITRAEFLEMVVKEIELQIDESVEHPYVDAALNQGIIAMDTFKNYNAWLTKSDASVVLVRADEYLNGVTITNEMIQMVLEKRILDISKVSKARQQFVAKCYALGYIIGTSNGSYSTNRKFNPNGNISVVTAKTLITRMKDKSKREVLSSDLQVIRNTKLPSNASIYPYILDSYPNAYYDWEFQFMKHLQGTPIYGTDKLINLKDYAAPVDIAKHQNGKYSHKIEESIPIWAEQIEKHLNSIFNVDYRTIKKDKDWYQTVLETSADFDYGDITRKRLEDSINNYIYLMIRNETIIESDKIAFDMSTLYDDSGYYVRFYVHFRINSAVEVEQMKAVDELGNSALFYCQNKWPDLKNVKLGEWRDGYFDVHVSSNKGLGIYEVVISDYCYNVKVVDN